MKNDIHGLSKTNLFKNLILVVICCRADNKSFCNMLII